MEKVNCTCDFMDRDFERIFIYHLLSCGHFNVLGSHVVGDCIDASNKKDVGESRKEEDEKDLFSLLIYEDKDRLVFEDKNGYITNPLYIHKYKPFPEVQKEVATHFGLQMEGLESQGSNEAKAIAFFSLNGGIGTTSMAVNFARILSREGYNPLFLSLSNISSWQRLADGFGVKKDPSEFGRILYSLENKKGFGPALLTSEIAGIKAVGSPLINRYQEEFNKERYIEFKQSAFRAGFDVLVMDVGTNLCQRMIEIMNHANHIVQILPPDRTAIDVEIEEVERYIKNSSIIRMINQRYESSNWKVEEDIYPCHLSVPYFGELSERSVDGNLGDCLRVILGLMEKGIDDEERHFGGNNRKIH